MTLAQFFCIFLLLAACKAQDGDESPGGIPWYVWVVIVICGFLSALLIICLAYYTIYNFRYYCLQSSSKPQPPGTELKELEELDFTDPLGTHSDSNVDWELDRKTIKLCNQLGIGEFGPIYDAEVQLDVNMMSRAVVKVFRQGTTQDLVHFREDIEGLMHLQHPRIGRLFGLVSQPPYYVVMELTINGDLKTFLVSAAQRESEDGLSSAQLVAMATDVASGLSYMESKNYVHEDVAIRNCIVMQNLSVKITDFKVGRYLHRSEYAVQNDGSLMPIRWMAPESLTKNKFSLKGAVWSYGVLVWEVMSRGAFPYQELSDPEVIEAVCSTRETLLQPADCPDAVYQEMLRCWNYTPSERPTMDELHQTLKSSILTNRY